MTSSGDPYAYKVVPTGVLAQDAATAEAHEGMALRFENVTITDVNADGPDTEAGFGECQFSSDGTEANEVRADDFSEAIPTDFNVQTSPSTPGSRSSRAPGTSPSATSS